MNTPDGTKLYLALEFDKVQLTDTIPISELFRPDNNFIATPILARLLDAILESVGQLLSPALSSGPLNHSFFMCSVRDANTAAKTLMPLFRELRLDGGAKLYRYDVSEGVLRCIFPAAGDVISTDEFLQKVLNASNLVKVAMTRAAELAPLVEGLKPTNQTDDA